MRRSSRCWIVLAVLWGILTPAAAAAEKVEISLSAEEKEILDLVNQERRKEKLALLRPNPLLFESARGHSQNMARQKKLSHVLDGKELRERIRALGYKDQFLSENLATVPMPSAKEVMRVWLDSPAHRKNVLDERFEEIGIGGAVDDGGDAYYTQVFGTPAKTK